MLRVAVHVFGTLHGVVLCSMRAAACRGHVVGKVREVMHFFKRPLCLFAKAGPWERSLEWVWKCTHACLAMTLRACKVLE